MFGIKDILDSKDLSILTCFITASTNEFYSYDNCTFLFSLIFLKIFGSFLINTSIPVVSLASIIILKVDYTSFEIKYAANKSFIASGFPTKFSIDTLVEFPLDYLEGVLGLNGSIGFHPPFTYGLPTNAV